MRSNNKDATWLPDRAKLNFFLHIQERRHDGFHDLESLIAFAELHDIVAIEEANCLQLVRSGPFAAEIDVQPEQDLVFRAATALAKSAGVEPKVKISLTKNIPVSAGLGGGSSDAAATLKLLSRRWNIPNDEIDITNLALTLGADVPACLHGKEALVRGVGDIVIPTSLPNHKIDVVLVKPEKSLSTASVFKLFKGPYIKEGSQDLNFAKIGSLAAFLSGQTNSLTAPAQTLCPDIATALSCLNDSEGCYLSRLSGSGPTCFGLFVNDELAEASAARITKTYPNWWVVKTVTSRNELST